MRFKVVHLLGVAALMVGIGAGTAAAQSIGLNFVNSSASGVQDAVSDSIGPDEVAGAPGYEQFNWNNLGRWGQTVAVKDSSGAASGVTVTWDSNNTWAVGNAIDTGDDKLMYGYIDATGQANDNSTPYQFWSNANKPEVYVAGLSQWLAAQGAPEYNVVVYTDGDVAEGRRSEYWLQSVSGAADPPDSLGDDLSSHVFVSDVANFSGTYTQVPLSASTVDSAGEGNFFVFTGISADSFVLRTEEHTFRATINGVQIVAVPEPASLGLLGLGAMGLLARRRRA